MEMRILLQNKLNNEYLAANGWVIDLATARDFDTVPLAVRFAVQRKLNNVRLVLDMSSQFGHERWNARFELRVCDKPHIVEEGVFKNRRVVYPEQQTGLPQKQ